MQQYGICNLNCVPVRKSSDDRSEMVTQLLFGDEFEIIEKEKQWHKIRIHFDQYEGWIDEKQFKVVSADEYAAYQQQADVFLSDLIEYVFDKNNQLTALGLGANLKAAPLLNLTFESHLQTHSKKLDKTKLLEIASLYLNAPYLWGGKTPFGIDCSGFTQMVYRIAGYALARDASAQALQGESLSFIEETEPGDLAFFDNNEGEIIHVGMVLDQNYIVHAHGKVRIDRLDHTGIFNTDTGLYSHKLRIIKKII